MASKSIVMFLLANLAMFAFVSTNAATCPNLSVCANIVNDLVSAQFGSQTTSQCCRLITGLAALDAAACVCTSLKTTALGPLLSGALSLLGGIVNLQSQLSAVLNPCGVNMPTNYVCS